MDGEELRRIRKRLALSQSQLAEQLGITTSSVARQEQGVIGISGSTAKLARLLLELAEKEQAAERKPKRSKKLKK
jgi:DNA-binding transcriptional regulator YiaG